MNSAFDIKVPKHLTAKKKKLAENAENIKNQLDPAPRQHALSHLPHSRIQTFFFKEQIQNNSQPPLLHTSPHANSDPLQNSIEFKDWRFAYVEEIQVSES